MFGSYFNCAVNHATRLCCDVCMLFKKIKASVIGLVSSGLGLKRHVKFIVSLNSHHQHQHGANRAQGIKKMKSAHIDNCSSVKRDLVSVVS